MEFKEIHTHEEMGKEVNERLISLGLTFERNRDELQAQHDYISGLDLPHDEKNRLLEQIAAYQEQLQRKYDENIRVKFEQQLEIGKQMNAETQKNIENLRKSLGSLTNFKAQASVDASAIEKGKQEAADSAKRHEEMKNEYQAERQRAQAEIERQRRRIFTRV